MKKPRWANKKTKKKQGRISLKMPVISDFFTENVTFSRNIPTFPQKVIFYPPKFLMAFFSHQLKISNFHLIFANNTTLFN